jgi:hypothetical protein
MNRNGNETESFAGNFVASDEQGLFFEVPNIIEYDVASGKGPVQPTCQCTAIVSPQDVSALIDAAPNDGINETVSGAVWTRGVRTRRSHARPGASRRVFDPRLEVGDDPTN